MTNRKNSLPILLALLAISCLAMSAQAADNGTPFVSVYGAPSGVTPTAYDAPAATYPAQYGQYPAGPGMAAYPQLANRPMWENGGGASAGPGGYGGAPGYDGGGAGGDSCGGNGCGAPCNFGWTVTVDATLLHRSPSGKQLLLSNPIDQSDILRSSDMEFPFAAGPRVSLVWQALCDWEIEGNFFSIDGWTASKNYSNVDIPSPAGFANLILDDTLQQAVSSVRFIEHSKLYSSELNVRRPLNDWVTLLGGFRWVELYDDHQADGILFYDETAFRHTIDAANHLYGFQMGADVSFFPESGGCPQFAGKMLGLHSSGRFRLNGFIKAGIFYNAASQSSVFANPDGQGELSAAAHGNYTSFLGETGLIASYQVNEHLAFHCGYQVMWIDGLALAPTQIPVTDLGTSTAAIDMSSGLFYHGATAGMEITW